MAPQIFVKHKKIFENVFEEKNPTKFATIWGREKVNHVTFSEKEEYLSFVGFHSVQWDVVQLPHFLWWSCNKIKDNYWNEAFVPSPERIMWNLLESKPFLKNLRAGQNFFGWIELVDENRQKHSYLWLKKHRLFLSGFQKRKTKSSFITLSSLYSSIVEIKVDWEQRWGQRLCSTAPSISLCQLRAWPGQSGVCSLTQFSINLRPVILQQRKWNK